MAEGGGVLVVRAKGVGGSGGVAGSGDAVASGGRQRGRVVVVVMDKG